MQKAICAAFFIIFSTGIYSTDYNSDLDYEFEAIEDSIFSAEDAKAIFNKISMEKISLEESICLTFSSGAPGIIIAILAHLGAELTCPNASGVVSNLLCNLCSGATSLSTICFLGSLCTPVGVALYNYWIDYKNIPNELEKFIIIDNQEKI